MGVIIVGFVDPEKPVSVENLSWASINDSIWSVFGDIFDEVLIFNNRILSNVKSEEFIYQEAYSFQMLDRDDFNLLVEIMRDYFSKLEGGGGAREIAAEIWVSDIEPLIVKDFRYME